MIQSRRLICFFLTLFFAKVEAAGAAERTFAKRVGSFFKAKTDDAARAIAKIHFSGLPKFHQETLTRYYNELSQFLTPRQIEQDPLFNELKNVLHDFKLSDPEYIKGNYRFTNVIEELEKYHARLVAAGEDVAKKATLTSLEKAQRATMLVEQADELADLAAKMEAEKAGIKVSQTLRPRSLKEASPQHVMTVSSPPPLSPVAPPVTPVSVVSPSSAVIATPLGGAATASKGSLAVQSAKTGLQAVKKTASAVGSVVKKAAGSELAQKLYAPLVLVSIGTVIAVIEELDRIKKEEEEALEALEKQKLLVEQKAFAERLKKAEEDKKEKDRLALEAELKAQEKTRKERILLQKNLEWQKLTIDVVSNLQELAKEFEKKGNAALQKQFNTLSIKRTMMKMLDDAFEKVVPVDLINDDIEKELLATRQPVQNLRDAFYAEMRAKENISLGLIQNRFANAKVFETETFKKYGIKASKALGEYLDTIVAEYVEILSFARSLEN